MKHQVFSALSSSGFETKPIVAVDPECWDQLDVGALLRTFPEAKFIKTGDIGIDNICGSVPKQDMALIVVGLETYGGLEAYKKIKAYAKATAKTKGALATAFYLGPQPSVSQSSLPPHCFVAGNQKDLRSIILNELKTKPERSWELRNREQIVDLPSAEVRARPIRYYDFPIPNFNVKHPSMLLPIGMASAKSGLELFCEISPREAFLFHGCDPLGNVVDELGKAFVRLRQHADRVEAETGGKIRLHLDHADDLDIISAACKAGFDSIMADGSGRSIHQNIIFTNRATELAKPYGCVIEGEIGAIDGDGSGKWSYTTVDELKRFIDRCDLDYVGISVGQFHGFDYGFSQTRRSLVDLRTQDEEQREGYALAQALHRLEKQLCKAGHSPTSIERIAIRNWSVSLLSPKSTSDIERRVLEDCFSSDPRTTSLRSLLLEYYFEEAAAQRRKTNKLWAKAFSYKQKRQGQARQINLNLVGRCSDLLEDKKTRLVIHGGSSIPYDQLCEFSRYRLSRVNFGTTVFERYIQSLSGMCGAYDRISYDQSSDYWHYGVLLNFLDEATRGWETWDISSNLALDSFANYLISSTVTPLRSKSETPKERLYAI